MGHTRLVCRYFSLCFRAKYRQDEVFPAGLPVFFGSGGLCRHLLWCEIPTRWSVSGCFAGSFRLGRPLWHPVIVRDTDKMKCFRLFSRYFRLGKPLGHPVLARNTDKMKCFRLDCRYFRLERPQGRRALARNTDKMGRIRLFCRYFRLGRPLRLPVLARDTGKMERFRLFCRYFTLRKAETGNDDDF